MLIDWFTVGAQVLNFLILVWLLKRFLYKPILDAIDAREKRIAGQIGDAESKKAEAQKEQDDFRNKNEAFDEQRSALFSKAEDEAKTERDGMLNAARKDAADLRAAQETALHEDHTRLSGEITRSAAEEVIGIARKALEDLATVSLEERVEEVFTRRLRGMQGDSRLLMGEALKSASGTAIVRSSFDLSVDQKAAIQNAINETFSANIHVNFELSAALVCGIELTGNGQKLDWNIASYLTALDRGVGALLDSQTALIAEPAPNPNDDVKSEPEASAVVHAGAN